MIMTRTCEIQAYGEPERDRDEDYEVHDGTVELVRQVTFCSIDVRIRYTVVDSPLAV